MDHNPKKCKGIGKAHGVSGCGTKTLYRKYGLCTSCLSEFYREDERGKIIVQKSILKAVSPRLKAQKDLEVAFVDKKARTSLGALKEQTQRLFNKYIRIRDQGLNCISEDIPYRSDFDAGHAFSVGSYEGLRYDFDNCHGQSILGNRFKEGNHSDYMINLPKRIGKERVQALIERAAEYKRNGHKFSRPELLEIQAEIKLKIKQL